ncbi:acyl-CoA N-acyltransferase [Jackrogersella minutella]|nr:acyl-CoA N-acyltransferase [Jackrogersella minutella]
MPPPKRKRPLDEPPPRRATRRHPGSTDEPERQLRSGRVRAVSIEKHAPARAEVLAAKSARGDAPRRPGRPPGKKGTAATERVLKENIQPENHDDEDDEEELDTVELLRHSSPDPIRITSETPPPQTRPTPPRKSSLQHQQPTRQTHTAPTEKTSTPKRPLSSADKPLKPPPTPRSDRNIDKVVLGNICFKAWYPSYYGKDVLGDISNPNNNNNVGGKDRDREGGGKIGGRIGGGKRAPPPMLDRLYVCPCCFKYSRELVAWWEHVRCCEKTFEIPGRKVYTHPKGSRTVKIPIAAEGSERPKGRGRRRSDACANNVSIIEETVHDEGEWSVWEVDGEKDRLFCQNMSLFAKLFLDNKSVFFDVTGFNYFLLVYTPPPPPSSSGTQPHTSSTTAESMLQPLSPPHTLPSPTNTTDSQHPPTLENRPQVVGFFSKEKLSWDNNNLACILVFPPWQRKGLGALLMGVSYEISRREGILGGPEKPISELGRKGYKRFWAGEIARWLLDLELPGAGQDDDDDDDDKGAEKETRITVDQCSKATWIVPEDCLAVLREMGLAEDAGMGVADTAADEVEKAGEGDGDGGEEGETNKMSELVHRVKVDKQAVRRWVESNRIGLTRACDPDGFVEGYAVREAEGEEVDEG